MKTQRVRFLRSAPGCVKVIWLMMLLLLIPLLTTGCGTKKPVLEFTIEAEETANNGQPVYLVVRTVNSNDFATQDYQSIASLVMQNPPDKSILQTQLILPDRDTEFEIVKPDNLSLAVYCMFTKPDQWKVFLQKPLEDEYEFILEHNSISLDKGWF